MLIDERGRIVDIAKSHKMRYTRGYKYRLRETFWIFTNIFPDEEIMVGDIILTREGLLFIGRGYSWDGASNAIDTDTIMVGALVHDALYELLRAVGDELGKKCTINRPGAGARVAPGFMALREEADLFFNDLNKEGDMMGLRRAYVHRAVRDFGFYSAKCPRKVYTVG